MTQMRACSKILAESLHGAICADTMGIPWGACVLAHRFNEFKWRDWLATIGRPFEPLIMDRPLVRSIPRTKALANQLARIVRYKQMTRHPQLRPVAAATAEDVRHVANTLRAHVANARHFTHSRHSAVLKQKQVMLDRCEVFAEDYGLQFSP